MYDFFVSAASNVLIPTAALTAAVAMAAVFGRPVAQVWHGDGVQNDLAVAVYE